MVSAKLLALLAGATAALAQVEVETRTLDEIHEAALKEGGVVTCWHGGDEKNSRDSLKAAFEKRFPGMTLNVTVDLSKYHDGNLDQQIQDKGVYVDSVILQTLHDYPRWKEDGSILQYKPLGWDQVYDEFKDPDGYYSGLFVIAWSNVWNTAKTDVSIKEYADFLQPELKDKIVLTYPNDDDAVLYAFDLILQNVGYAWFDSLLAQNPRWVRGTRTPSTIVGDNSTQWAATFTSSRGLNAAAPFAVSFPETSAPFVSWPQTGAILKDAPHPESAKLLHSFILSEEWQTASGGWSARKDLSPQPAAYPDIFDMPGTNVTAFGAWMADRANVERVRFWFESKIGTAQGLSPLEDNL
ncbi:ABC-type fe3+ transport system protein [Lasiodiplodia theobromae]|uniref:ABC-type fe3+ transport system protein n=1 Tax=Lasiodiplodia theobromae TaxID=45133 RepID=UPI0015C39251|nr:ABC-type fe3+ transport system protein [Lasiodiplodia theobromae]KAF4543320.1 ABC-type fe3+ transport system protein [Lasiodiplodia theobromae]